ncbi:RNA-binding protein 12-like [Branchiostoma floridae]|uniref:RNA-binding protein 12-like n=1 Tax=Branchiostoma floridae TaxID=7739 RepID=A0A9J7MSB3_BRAFL|nr:RNA-binding protein 12-like [Branchiostoma floridae]
MAVVIRLQGLPWSASAMDIRSFFSGLTIPDGGVHIVGGDAGDAFIIFASDEDARQAMARTGNTIHGSPITLYLSSRKEMQDRINMSRSTTFDSPAPVATGNVEKTQSPAFGSRNVAPNGSSYAPPPVQESSYSSMSSSSYNSSQFSAAQTCIQLFGLNTNVTVSEIHSLFSGLEIASDGIVIEMDPFGNKTGKAFVKFKSVRDCSAAVRTYKEYLAARHIEVMSCTESQWQIAYDFAKAVQTPAVSYANTNTGMMQRMQPQPRQTQPPPQHSRSPVMPRSGAQQNRAQGTQRPRSRSPIDRTDSMCISLKGLPYTAKDKDVRDFFKGLGIRKVWIDFEDGKAIGSGFVEFKSYGDQKAALRMHKKYMGSRYIEVTSAPSTDMQKHIQKFRETRKAQNEKKKAEAAKKAAAEAEVRKADDARKMEENKRAEENRRAESRRAEEARKAADAEARTKREAEAKKAAEARKAAASATVSAPVPTPSPLKRQASSEPISEPSPAKKQAVEPTPSVSHPPKSEEKAKPEKVSPEAAAEVKVESKADEKTPAKGAKAAEDQSSKAGPEKEKAKHEAGQSDPKAEEKEKASKKPDTKPKKGSKSPGKEAKTTKELDPRAKCCMHVWNLPYKASKREIENFFTGSTIAERGIHMVYTKTGEFSGEVFVEFVSISDCDRAYKLRAKRLGGRMALLRPISREEMRDRMARPTQRDMRTSDKDRDRRQQDRMMPQDQMQDPPRRGPQGPQIPSLLDLPSNAPLGRNVGMPPFQPQMGVQQGPGLVPGGNMNMPNVGGPPAPAFNTNEPLSDIVGIQNLPMTATMEEILDFFYGYPVLKDSVHIHRSDRGDPTGNASVAFPTPQDAMIATRELNGRPMGVKKLRLLLI